MLHHRRSRPVDAILGLSVQGTRKFRQGTGSAARLDTIRVAGKTGTAQTSQPGKNHGWFIGFCPADKPALAIAILAEFGGSGGGFAAGTAGVICKSLAAS